MGILNFGIIKASPAIYQLYLVAGLKRNTRMACLLSSSLRKYWGCEGLYRVYKKDALAKQINVNLLHLLHLSAIQA
jgi:hypothetical protein